MTDSVWVRTGKLKRFCRPDRRTVWRRIVVGLVIGLTFPAGLVVYLLVSGKVERWCNAGHPAGIWVRKGD